MAETLIKNFTEISKTDTEIAGGKGASLGEMTQAGIPVPEGFVILSNAFDRFLEETDLNVEIDAVLDTVDIKEVHTVENASEKIQAMIFSKEMPEELKTKILKNYNNLDCKFVAVRSSATSEDSVSAAWAGQLDSFLNTTNETLLENVKKCWASLFTPRAIFYRFEKKLSKDKISVAVVVQKMVDSEESGIAFSVHPVTQDENQIIIEAGFGLGEAIVSGSITPDSYVVDKQGFSILDINVNEQTKALYKKSIGGNEWKELGEKGKKQVLNENEIIELSKLIVKIENHYGFPCDIEWAKETGKFYILQSRPITTLSKKIGFQEKSTEYVRMFEATGMPFLINSIALEYYKPLKVMAIFRDNLWTTFIPKLVQKEALKEGVELFGSKALFLEYSNEFSNYKKDSENYFQEIVTKESISKTELDEFFHLISKLWEFYKKTEFFYVDEAYKTSKKDKTTANNLKHLEEIKNSGREHLNKMIFGSASYLSKALKILSKQFDLSVDDLFFYSKEEILNLYNQQFIEKNILDERRTSYVFLIRDGKLINMRGRKAEEYISNFMIEHKANENIKGIIANPGKVTGKAKVLFYGADTFDKVSKMINEMKRGDVLVTETTSPEIMLACKKASAILTNQGGLLSHAAIMSRELKIPCIVGLEDITHIISNGDLLEVDANKGYVKILKKANK